MTRSEKSSAWHHIRTIWDGADSRHGHLCIGGTPVAERCRFSSHGDEPWLKPKKNDKPITRQFEFGIDPDNSLLPMLIGGLVLIIIGAIVVMMFV